MGVGVNKNLIRYVKRGPYDDISTPYAAYAPLVPHLKKWMIGLQPIVWESAPSEGGGKLVEMLEASDFNVTWKPYPPFDFFEWQPDLWHVQVTNPPFSMKAKWVKRSVELDKPFALLLPVTALGSRNVNKWIDGCEIILFPKRIDFTGGGAPWFSVMWLTKGLKIGKGITVAD